MRRSQELVSMHLKSSTFSGKQQLYGTAGQKAEQESFLKVRDCCTTAPKGQQIKAFCDVCVPASLIKAEYVQVQVYDLPL